jgi:hypothetical protein
MDMACWRAVLAAIALLSAVAPANAAMSCADLASFKIAPGDIGLPTKGATITSAQMQSVPPTRRAERRQARLLQGARLDRARRSECTADQFQVNLPPNGTARLCSMVAAARTAF